MTQVLFSLVPQIFNYHAIETNDQLPDSQVS